MISGGGCARRVARALPPSLPEWWSVPGGGRGGVGAWGRGGVGGGAGLSRRSTKKTKKFATLSRCFPNAQRNARPKKLKSSHRKRWPACACVAHCWLGRWLMAIFFLPLPPPPPAVRGAVATARLLLLLLRRLLRWPWPLLGVVAPPFTECCCGDYCRCRSEKTDSSLLPPLLLLLLHHHHHRRRL